MVLSGLKNYMHFIISPEGYRQGIRNVSVVHYQTKKLTTSNLHENSVLHLVSDIPYNNFPLTNNSTVP